MSIERKESDGRFYRLHSGDAPWPLGTSRRVYSSTDPELASCVSMADGPGPSQVQMSPIGKFHRLHPGDAAREYTVVYRRLQRSGLRMLRGVWKCARK
ncbi:hypothetical protein PoB_000764300 [Plakobranchus ocellatus]|uniref:Uncharacterized protein n=1 Tax=Plakobranchus ocellatus TaxID=259542 RepID=A0AAV3YF94_9GAST|nr:hypothetical protein PoB_000764300 [Plakobranchus ocellatus]